MADYIFSRNLGAFVVKRILHSPSYTFSVRFVRNCLDEL